MARGREAVTTEKSSDVRSCCALRLNGVVWSEVSVLSPQAWHNSPISSDSTEQRSLRIVLERLLTLRDNVSGSSQNG
jgi:hypothetical protein